mgnify:CR=1 FL=1
MKHLTRSLLVVLSLVLVACQGPGVVGPGVDDPGAPEGVIVGTLTDRAGVPLVGAQVTLGGGSVSAAGLTTVAVDLVFTNVRGEFAFNVGEEGEYTLTSLLDDQGAFARVLVTRGADGKLVSGAVSLQAVELGAVAGRIAGKGAGAWAYLLGTSFLASTDADGAFVISRVPAGTYQLAPGLLGATGAPVSVTVEAGKLTTVAAPLVLGPVITGVEPSGFSTWGRAWDTGSDTPSEVVIRGSGFGDEVGLSQLRYAGWELSNAVLSWSDDEIVLSTRHDWGRNRTVDFEELRFSFASVTGSALSNVGGIVSGYGSTFECLPAVHNEGWVGIAPRVFWDTRVRGAEVAFTVFNGSARSGPGGAMVSVITTDDDGCAAAYIEADANARLPVVAEVSFHGATLEPLVVGNGAYLELDSYYVEPGPNVVQGQLLLWETGEPMDDDGNYTAGMSCMYRGVKVEVPISLDNEGRFSVPLEVSDEPWCDHLVIKYRGVEVSGASLSVISEPETQYVAATTSAYSPVASAHLQPGWSARFEVEVDATVANAGAALYLELSQDLPTEVVWRGAAYYSASRERFSATPMGPASEGQLQPSSIDVLITCRGSCVIVDSTTATAVVTVTNPYEYDYFFDLYAYTEAFNDLSEPMNDSRAGAELFSLTEGASGALETIGDVDYYQVSLDGPSSGILDLYTSGFVEAVVFVEDASGLTEHGPYYPGDHFDVLAGDYLRVQAVGDVAAASANSAYYLYLVSHAGW